MPATDFYKTLGVSRTATADEIRKAYKKLARKYHPDVAKDDQDAAKKFQEVQQAYDVLGDTDKRQQYDRFGAGYQGAAGGQGAGPQWSSGGGPVDLGDLFGGQFDLNDLFGGGGFRPGGGARKPRPRRGSDVQTEIDIPFQLAAGGGQYDLFLNRDGKREQLTVKIPPGVDTGSVIRLAGQGEPGGSGGPAGDLRVTVKVTPHPYFRREGHNLLIDVPLTISEAALGAKVDVPTLSEGNVTVTIPPGTSSGAKLRLRGKGIVDRSTHKPGDQFVVVKIVVPHKIDDRARELLRELETAMPQDPRSNLW